MNPPEEPGRRRAAPVDPSAERYEALLEVLEHQAKRTVERTGSTGPAGRARGWKLVLLGGLVVLTAWLWFFPPAWIDATPPEPPIAEEEAALRFAMYLQAQRIRAFQLETGRLPLTLDEAGDPLTGMEYVRLDDARFELTGNSERLSLTYRSGDPLDAFVGSGAEVIDVEALQ